MYLRHRPRLVMESVIQDLRNTLIACRWMVGTTSVQVLNPATELVEFVTTTAEDVFPLAGEDPVVLMDYFPEEAGEITEPNTFAVDVPTPEDPEDLELGSSLHEQMYVFNFAFFAESDALGMAVMSDLSDRYDGRLLGNGSIDLYDFVNEPDLPAARMEVDVFRWTRDLNGIVPEGHLFFGELTIVDFVDGPNSFYGGDWDGGAP